MASIINATTTNGVAISADNSGILQLATNSGTTAVTIDASQNVGIGTSSIGAHLDVTDSIQIKYTGSSQYGAGTLILKNNVSTANQQQVRLFNQVADTGNTYSAFNISQFNSSGAFVQGLASYQMAGDYWIFSTANSERMRIDSSGNVLVGTTSQIYSGAKLQINGIIAGVGYGTRAGATGSFGTNAYSYYWTGSALQAWIDSTNVGTVTLVSDYRLKQKVETQATPALERVIQLRPVTYEFKDYGAVFKADGVAREGFIAHELQAVIPSAVEGEKDAEGQLQSLKLDALCSVMVKAIQELKDIIDLQQTQITALNTKVGI